MIHQNPHLKNHTFWLKVVMWVSVALSVSAVILAVVLKDPSFGQRGGAIGVAFSFAILFLGKSTPQRALYSETATLPDLLDSPAVQGVDKGDLAPEDLKARIGQLEDSELRISGALSAMLDWSEKEKVFLTVSSVVSTIFWGFGDYFAKWLATWFGVAL